MLHKVGPSLFCWCYLGFFASLAWLFSGLKMDFLNKITGVVANILVRMTIIFSWFVLNVLLLTAFLFFLSQPRHARLFHVYKRLGKTVGSALLFFGNIGLYYYSEKSIACMLTFLFLALHCLCALFCIQPYTDFGVLEFLLGASLNQGLCLFGIHSYSFWFVLIACIVMVGLRYYLEPTNQSKSEMELNSNLTLPVQAISAPTRLPPKSGSPFRLYQTQRAYPRRAAPRSGYISPDARLPVQAISAARRLAPKSGSPFRLYQPRRAYPAYPRRAGRFWG